MSALRSLSGIAVHPTVGAFGLRQLCKKTQEPAPATARLKMPYLALTDESEAVDDPQSRYYNQLVKRSAIAEPDWRSSEQMRRSDVLYRWGVFVEHNTPARHVRGAGVAEHGPQAENAITLQSKPGDVLIASHKELEGATKTGLMLTAAKAATKAAQNSPLEVANTSQFRDLTNSSSRIFGWSTKSALQPQFNQVVISQEQLAQIRALRASMTEEEKDEIAKRQATPEGQNELRKVGAELQERAQNMEQPKLPPMPGSGTWWAKVTP